eukprot:scaffold889_cov379-Prasinococcus_capsulatus_cf.AAC.6
MYLTRGRILLVRLLGRQRINPVLATGCVSEACLPRAPCADVNGPAVRRPHQLPRHREQLSIARTDWPSSPCASSGRRHWASIPASLSGDDHLTYEDKRVDPGGREPSEAASVDEDARALRRYRAQAVTGGRCRWIACPAARAAQQLTNVQVGWGPRTQAVTRRRRELAPAPRPDPGEPANGSENKKRGYNVERVTGTAPPATGDEGCVTADGSPMRHLFGASTVWPWRASSFPWPACCWRPWRHFEAELWPARRLRQTAPPYRAGTLLHTCS